jgi:hypothetical protein
MEHVFRFRFVVDVECHQHVPMCKRSASTSTYAPHASAGHIVSLSCSQVGITCLKIAQ